MKLLEITFCEDHVKVRRQSEEHLDADQKFTLYLCLIGALSILVFFYLFTH